MGMLSFFDMATELGIAQREGAEVTLAIRPGSWIKHGECLVLMAELRVGHDVHV
jgi:hypothetical protein